MRGTLPPLLTLQQKANSYLMEQMKAMKLAAGANSDIVNRREMEMTAQISPRKAGSGRTTLVTDDSLVGRPPAGSLTDAIMVAELRREIIELRSDAEASAARAREVKKQVAAREKEIERLSRLVEAGQDVERFNLESINQTNQRIIETLNDQVDFLNEELASRDAQLAAKDDVAADLETANKKLSHLQDALARSEKRCARLQVELNELGDMGELLTDGGDDSARRGGDGNGDGDGAGSGAGRRGKGGITESKGAVDAMADAVASQAARKASVRAKMAELQQENLRLKVRRGLLLLLLMLLLLRGGGASIHVLTCRVRLSRFLVQAEAERVAAMADAYTADKQAYARTIANLEDAKRAAEARVTAARRQVDAAGQEAAEARASCEHLQAKVAALERDNELHQNAITSLQSVRWVGHGRWRVCCVFVSVRLLVLSAALQLSH